MFCCVADARPKASIGRRQKPMEGAIRHRKHSAENAFVFLPPAGGVREGSYQSLGKTLRLMTSTTVVMRATMRKAVSSPVWRAMKPIAAGPARIPA